MENLLAALPAWSLGSRDSGRWGALPRRQSLTPMCILPTGVAGFAGSPAEASNPIAGNPARVCLSWHGGPCAAADMS